MSVRIALLSLLFGCIAPASFAEPYFASCSKKTGSTASVILPAAANPTINGKTLSKGSEIAVYTPEGVCAGRALWNEKNLAITVWGDNILTSEKEGLEGGDRLIFQVWDAQSRRLYVGPELVQTSFDNAKSYLRTDPTFIEGAIFRLTSISVDTRLSPSLLAPVDGSKFFKTSVPLSWRTANGSSSYQLQVSNNSSFSKPIIDETVLGTESEVSVGEDGVYYWRVGADTPSGTSWSETYSFAMGGNSGLTREELAHGFALDQNYPNPFNPSTTIPFEMIEGADVSLAVYNMIGQKVATLVDGFVPAGKHSVQWLADDVPSGMYVYRIASERGAQTRSLTLIK